MKIRNLPCKSIIIVILFYLILTGINIINIKFEESTCKYYNYDYIKDSIMEKGYIECCNNIYKDHIKVSENCTAIKKNIWGTK